MLGLFCRAAVFTACGAAAFAAHVPSAQACSPVETPSIYPQLPPEQLADVPTDGVLAFHAQTFGELDEVLALLAIEVTLDGVAVDGALETVVRSESDVFGEPAHDLFVVWRPAAALAPDSSYEATIRFTSSEFSEEELAMVSISTAGGPAVLPSGPDLDEPELLAVPVDLGQRVCCDDGNSCGIHLCDAPQSEDRPQLSARVATEAGPMARQGYIQLLHGTDEAFGDPTIVGLAEDAHDVNFTATLADLGAEYCLAVEYVSLIDGSTSERTTSCLAGDELELGSGPNPSFPSFLDSCVGDPYWEDTEEPYEPDAGTGTDGGDGGSDGDGGDADGDGGDADADGGDADGDGGSDDGADGGGADGGGGLDDDARGCACHVEGPSSPWSTALGLFVIGAFVGRRRRVPRSQ